MRKSIFVLAISNFVAGILGTSCKSDADSEMTTEEARIEQEATEHRKMEMEEEELIDSINTINIAKNDSIEWNAYKKEVKTEIEINKKLIKNLKTQAKKSDQALLENVNQIEKTNADILVKVDSYTISSENDWEDFKRELEKQLEELDKSIDKVASIKKK
ncbi:hypothetical protein FEDK69T_01140 [Flavobacterium enshiense DK69]|uniref:Lipoprotein n=1 Tax=Flavobacterium enshiense DK69 TaxID=1107311 RepID=V6SFY5_9FLAO|nr:hypothetical protein [Flavobacterium enshiense]ESU25147.1 hypothetical protein FEDK69T_01140 [Flavobacterium enshiense DK69]KGO96957.1 hypothetical protein Q767_04480 [Flavobacterium enshiense DK69]